MDDKCFKTSVSPNQMAGCLSSGQDVIDLFADVAAFDAFAADAPGVWMHAAALTAVTRYHPGDADAMDAPSPGQDLAEGTDLRTHNEWLTSRAISCLALDNSSWVEEGWTRYAYDTYTYTFDEARDFVCEGLVDALVTLTDRPPDTHAVWPNQEGCYDEVYAAYTWDGWAADTLVLERDGVFYDATSAELSEGGDCLSGLDVLEEVDERALRPIGGHAITQTTEVSSDTGGETTAVSTFGAVTNDLDQLERLLAMSRTYEWMYPYMPRRDRGQVREYLEQSTMALARNFTADWSCMEGEAAAVADAIADDLENDAFPTSCTFCGDQRHHKAYFYLGEDDAGTSYTIPNKVGRKSMLNGHTHTKIVNLAMALHVLLPDLAYATEDRLGPALHNFGYVAHSARAVEADWSDTDLGTYDRLGAWVSEKSDSEVAEGLLAVHDAWYDVVMEAHADDGSDYKGVTYNNDSHRILTNYLLSRATRDTHGWPEARVDAERLRVDALFNEPYLLNHPDFVEVNRLPNGYNVRLGDTGMTVAGGLYHGAAIMAWYHGQDPTDALAMERAATQQRAVWMGSAPYLEGRVSLPSRLFWLVEPGIPAREMPAMAGVRLWQDHGYAAVSTGGDSGVSYLGFLGGERMGGHDMPQRGSFSYYFHDMPLVSYLGFANDYELTGWSGALLVDGQGQHGEFRASAPHLPMTHLGQSPSVTLSHAGFGGPDLTVLGTDLLPNYDMVGGYESGGVSYAANHFSQWFWHDHGALGHMQRFLVSLGGEGIFVVDQLQYTGDDVEIDWLLPTQRYVKGTYDFASATLTAASTQTYYDHSRCALADDWVDHAAGGGVSVDCSDGYCAFDGGTRAKCYDGYRLTEDCSNLNRGLYEPQPDMTTCDLVGSGTGASNVPLTDLGLTEHDLCPVTEEDGYWVFDHGSVALEVTFWDSHLSTEERTIYNVQEAVDVNGCRLQRTVEASGDIHLASLLAPKRCSAAPDDCDLPTSWAETVDSEVWAITDAEAWHVGWGEEEEGTLVLSKDPAAAMATAAADLHGAWETDASLLTFQAGETLESLTASMATGVSVDGREILWSPEPVALSVRTLRNEIKALESAVTVGPAPGAPTRSFEAVVGLEDQAVINVFSSPWLTTDVRCESGHQVIEVSGSQQEQVRVVYAPGPSGCFP